MQITRGWIMAHRTERGAWTEVQILALGIDWPPKRGWISRIVGSEITSEKAAEFMAGNTVFSTKTLRAHEAQRAEAEAAACAMFPAFPEIDASLLERHQSYANGQI